MLQARPHPRIRAALVALLALCIALLGVALPRAALIADSAPDLTAYILPDGTLPVICQADPDHLPRDAADHGKHHCLACQLVIASTGASDPVGQAPQPIGTLALKPRPAPIDRSSRQDRARAPPVSASA